MSDYLIKIGLLWSHLPPKQTNNLPRFGALKFWQHCVGAPRRAWCSGHMVQKASRASCPKCLILLDRIKRFIIRLESCELFWNKQDQNTLFKESVYSITWVLREKNECVCACDIKQIEEHMNYIYSSWKSRIIDMWGNINACIIQFKWYFLWRFVYSLSYSKTCTELIWNFPRKLQLGLLMMLFFFFFFCILISIYFYKSVLDISLCKIGCFFLWKWTEKCLLGISSN